MAQTGFWSPVGPGDTANSGPHGPMGPGVTAEKMSDSDPPETSDPARKIPLRPASQSLSQKVADKLESGPSSSLSGSGSEKSLEKDSFLKSLENPIVTHMMPLSLLAGQTSVTVAEKRQLPTEGGESSSKSGKKKRKSGPEPKKKAMFSIIP